MKLLSAIGFATTPRKAAAWLQNAAVSLRSALKASRIPQRLSAWRPLAPVSLGLLSALLTLVTLRFSTADASWPLALGFLLRPWLFLANWLPLLLWALLWYYGLGKPYVAFALTAAPALGLALVNYYKLLLRGDPLLFADLTLVGEASAMSKRYAIHPTLAVIGVGAWAVITVLLLRHAFRRKTGPRVATRAAGCAVCAAMLLGCGELLVTSDALYADTGLACSWLPTQSYSEHGVLYPFLHSVSELRATPPEGYNEQKAAAALAAYPEDEIPEARRADVIAVMLEAFNDFTTFDNLDFTADPYADLRAIQAESYTGQLVVNAFAGETVNTERAFLTGYLDPSDNFRKPVNSFVWYFRRQGYTCLGAHPGYNWFYNRLNVNGYLGFEQYSFYEDRYNRYVPDGQITPDRQFFPTIVADYNAAIQKGKPVFSFNVSYQNHGPYETEPRYATAWLPWQAGYSTADYAIANNYLTGVAETCRQLKKLTEHFKNAERPVILVIFGDHNPWWGDKNSTYKMFGISLDRSTEEGFYNYYCTPYLIWANDAAKAELGDVFKGDGGRLSPAMLMERLFSLAGWEGPAYMKALRALAQNTPFVNRQDFLDHGVLTSVENAPAWLAQFRALEYYEKHSPVADAS